MKNTVRNSLLLALIGFALTLFFSLSTNIFSTSLVRGLVSGAVLFVIGSAAQWILGQVAQPGTPPQRADRPVNPGSLGRTLDLSTPNEQEELNRIIKQSDLPQAAEAAFEPLHPPQLTTKTDHKAQQLADALRTMSEK
jgi:hypothetical protein